MRNLNNGSKNKWQLINGELSKVVVSVKYLQFNRCSWHMGKQNMLQELELLREELDQLRTEKQLRVEQMLREERELLPELLQHGWRYEQNMNWHMVLRRRRPKAELQLMKKLRGLRRRRSEKMRLINKQFRGNYKPWMRSDSYQGLHHFGFGFWGLLTGCGSRLNCDDTSETMLSLFIVDWCWIGGGIVIMKVIRENT